MVSSFLAQIEYLKYFSLFIGNLVGNHCRKVIKKCANTDMLSDSVLSDEIDLFQSLDSLFSMLASDTIYSPTVIEKFDEEMLEFVRLWRESDLGLSTKMVKLHCFVAHLPDQIKFFKFSPATVGEHKLEESHQKVDTMFGHYGRSDNRILPFLVEYNGLQF